MKSYDVAIVGGGLAGSALAVALGRVGRRVALIEARPRKTDSRPSFDDRTLVVNAASLNILTNLEILDGSQVTCPIRRIEISRAGAPGHLSLRADDYGCDRFGAVIVARELGSAMLAALSRTEGVEEFCPASLERFELGQRGVDIELSDGVSLHAAVLVGADGTGSPVREMAGMESRVHDYHQSAMIFNVLPEKRRADIAFERFTSHGPLALLPQPAGRMGVVWIDRSAAIDEAMALDDQALCDRLFRRFGPTLGRFHSPGRRARYRLAQRCTVRPVAERVVLVGNAANTVHPVSAQGFNLGLRDVAALAHVIGRGADPGRPELLDRFLAMRQADHTATLAYTDTLARAFTNPSTLARLGATLGLGAHAAIPALSRRLVRVAMGFREPVSPLAREPVS